MLDEHVRRVEGQINLLLEEYRSLRSEITVRIGARTQRVGLSLPVTTAGLCGSTSWRRFSLQLVLASGSGAVSCSAGCRFGWCSSRATSIALPSRPMGSLRRARSWIGRTK